MIVRVLNLKQTRAPHVQSHNLSAYESSYATAITVKILTYGMVNSALFAMYQCP